MSKRTFIAFDLPENAKQVIFNEVERLKSRIPEKINWITQNQLHITAFFIGDTDIKDLEKISSIIRHQSLSSNPFTISNFRVEVIPENNPRLIWIAGDISCINVIRKLCCDMERSICELGYTKADKPFKTHITLGRIKEDISSSARKEILTTHFAFDRLTVNRITFYESFLHKVGPEYKVIESYYLQGDENGK